MKGENKLDFSLFSFLAVLLSSTVAAMGLGGGTVLLLYLSFFSSLTQPQMQSVNLLLFLPAAVISLLIHRKNGLIDTAFLKPCLLGGIIGGIGGSLLSNNLNLDLLKKGFGVFLLLIGIRELFLSLSYLYKNFLHHKA